MSRRNHHSADRLLEDLWAAWCSSTAASVQRLGAFSSWGAALLCADRTCRGFPAQKFDRKTDPPTPILDEFGNPVIHCSRCGKVWAATPVEMGTNEIGSRKPRRAVGREPIELQDVIELGVWVVDTVIDEDAVAALSWIIHVVGPGREHPKSGVPSLGVPRDEIPVRLQAAAQRGILDLGGVSLTEYRIRQGIAWSRGRVEEMIESRGGV